MFSQYLFNHKYDIDDLIAALCAPTPQWLNTEAGTWSAEEPTSAPTHRFLLEPLPAAYLAEIAHSTEQTHLSETEKAEIQTILAGTTVQQLPQHFNEGRTGGWLRERVKDAALEWLDGNDLIPPSMRHINRQKAAKLYATRTIKIEEI